MYHGISSHLGTSIETSLVDSPRDRSRFSGPGCVISRDPIKEGTSIETSFVDSQSTRRVPVVYFGISSSIGPQSRPCSWIPNPCDRSGLGIWGSLLHMGPQSRPRWWVDFALQNPSFVQAVQIIIYYRVVPSWMRNFFIHGLGGLPHERYIHDDTSEFK